MFQIKKDGSVTTTSNRFKAALAVLRGAEVKNAEVEAKGPLQAVPLPTSSASRGK